MSAYNADDGYDQHGIQQEGAQVVTGLQQDPDRGYGSNGNVDANDPHPGTGGEVERMEVHADGHAEHDGNDAQNGRSHHGSMTAVYGKTEYDSDQDEHDGDHGHGCVGSAGLVVNGAVHDLGAKGGSYDSRKGRNHQDQGQV